MKLVEKLKLTLTEGNSNNDLTVKPKNHKEEYILTSINWLKSGERLDRGYTIVAVPDEEYENDWFTVFKDGKYEDEFGGGGPLKGTDNVVNYVAKKYKVPVKEITYVMMGRRDSVSDLKKYGLK